MVTKEQREVYEAAIDAVDVDDNGRMVYADISRDPEKVSRLVKAVMALKSRRYQYWREA